MRYEPPIDPARLIEHVRGAYGIPAHKLEFVPVGFAAACYVLYCTGGDRYFLKLWPGLRLRHEGAARQYTTLTLTRALYDRGLYARVPYPIPTGGGALWAELDDSQFAVFPFLPGGMLPVPTPARLWTEFGRTIAAIHRATDALSDVLPSRERFAVPDEAGLRRCLAVVERIGSAERPGLCALRHLVLPREGEILAQYARLRSLRTAVRRLSGPLVLCHTDLGGANMLVHEKRQLYVLDWDDATVAPPEHDLWSALGEGFGSILDAYGSAGDTRHLHSEHFEFYLLRRYLWDMTARLERLLDANTVADEDDELLRGMEDYGFARWAALDDTIAGIGAALTQRER